MKTTKGDIMKEKEDWFAELAKAFVGSGLCFLAIIAVALMCLGGCAASEVPAQEPTIKTTYVPVGEDEYAPVVAGQKNPYEKTVEFLTILADLTDEEFVRLCAMQEGGKLFNPDEGALVCAQSETLIWSVQRQHGMPYASSVFVPRYGAKLLADAILEEVGPPTSTQDLIASWDLGHGMLSMGMDIQFALAVYTKYGVLAQN